jgi:hypothetical protein
LGRILVYMGSPVSGLMIGIESWDDGEGKLIRALPYAWIWSDEVGAKGLEMRVDREEGRRVAVEVVPFVAYVAAVVAVAIEAMVDEVVRACPKSDPRGISSASLSCLWLAFAALLRIVMIETDM